MKASTRLWRGIGDRLAGTGAAALLGTALLPAAFAGTAGESGEAGEAGEAGEGGASATSVFPGNLDKAVSNIFAGEGGEGGAGLTAMWPSVSAPALTGADIAKVVTGNTLRTEGHFAWYFAPGGALEGGYVHWSQSDAKNCPAQEDPADAFYRGTDGICYTYKLYPSTGSWAVRDNMLCVDIAWETGGKKDCRYLTILLDNLALFDVQGKIDGKGMKLLKGKALGE